MNRILWTSTHKNKHSGQECVAQAVEYLPSKLKDLCLNPVLQENKKKKKKKKKNPE
jgi:hypothetical protein